MSNKNDKDLELALVCLKLIPHKPDFDALAAELGIGRSTAYNRYWHLMKKAPALNGAPGTGSGANVPATPSPNKRTHKGKAKDELADDDDDDDDEIGASAKKVKTSKRPLKVEDVAPCVIKIEDDE